MFPHPETVYVVKEMDRKALLAEVELTRLAMDAAGERRRSPWAALRTAIGAGLIRIGVLLQGAPAPALPTAPAAD